MKELKILLFFSLIPYLTSNAQIKDYYSSILFKNCITLDAKESIQEERTDLIYNWQFGDGQSGQGEVIEHCYDSVGTYQVTLSIVDPSVVALFADEWNFEVTIEDDYNLSFQQVQNKNEVLFQSKLSSNEVPDEITYCWDFGDGNFAVGQTVTHQYKEDGNYQVRLMAEIKNSDEYLQLANSQSIVIKK